MWIACNAGVSFSLNENKKNQLKHIHEFFDHMWIHIVLNIKWANCKVAKSDEPILNDNYKENKKRNREHIGQCSAAGQARREGGSEHWGQTSYRREECPAPGALGSDSCVPPARPPCPRGGQGWGQSPPGPFHSLRPPTKKRYE